MTTITQSKLNNLNLVKDIIDGVDNKNGGLVVQAYNKISKLIIMEQYYLIKGLKLSDKIKFMESIKYAPVEGRAACRLIIDNLYGDQDDNIKAGYNGMGNIDMYVTQIKAL